MSIRKKQILQHSDKIIAQTLKSGRLPTPTQVNRQLSHYKRQHRLGVPTMQPQFIEKRSEVDIPAHNNMLNRVYDDLEILYDETIEQVQHLDSFFLQYYVKSKSLEHQISKTQAELRSLMLVADNTNHYIHAIYDDLDDHIYIDQHNTTAHLEDGAALCRTAKMINYTIEHNIHVSVFPHNIKGVIKSYDVPGTHIDNVINTYVDATWQHHIKTNQPGTYGCSVILQAVDPIEISHIKINTHTINPITISIRYSPDRGVNWFTLHREETSTTLNINFNTTKMTDIQVIMYKREHDFYDTDGQVYTYGFGLKSIILDKVTYQQTSVLQSVNFDISDIKGANRVSLWVDEEIPPQTDIQYEAKINDKWTRISPVNREQPTHPTVIDAGAVVPGEPIVLEMSDDYPLSHYEIIEHYMHMQNFYALGTVPNNILEKSTTLYKGVNMWESFIASGDLLSTPINQLSSLLDRVSMGEVGFIPINETSPSLILTTSNHENYTQRYTLRIDTPNSQTISHAHPICNSKIGIYLNGNLLFHGRPSAEDTVTYNLKAGANYLDVLCYIPTEQAVAIDISIDLNKFRMYMYGHQHPIKEVSMSKLKWGVAYQNKYRYAIDNNTIVLGHAPIGIPYMLTYKRDKYPLEEVAIRATFVNMQQHHNMDLAAKLNGYEIRIA